MLFIEMMLLQWKSSGISRQQFHIKMKWIKKKANHIRTIDSWFMLIIITMKFNCSLTHTYVEMWFFFISLRKNDYHINMCSRLPTNTHINIKTQKSSRTNDSFKCVSITKIRKTRKSSKDINNTHTHTIEYIE